MPQNLSENIRSGREPEREHTKLKISVNTRAKIPREGEKFSVVRKNFNMVVTGLKVKFEQVIIATKYLCSDAQVFAFNLLLVNKLVDMSKIQN